MAEKPADKTCQICSRNFIGRRGKPNKYCSKACYEQQRDNDKFQGVCAQCQKSFQRKLSKAGPYCTQACQRAFQKENQRTTAQCLQCQGVFTRKKSLPALFCSDDCYHESQQKHEIVTSTCAECSQEFTYSLARHGLRRYCTRECYAKSAWEGKSFTSACEQCGKEFRNNSYRTRKYCSDKCYYEFKAAELITKPCPYCRRDFTCNASWPLIHCSRKCQRLSQQRDLMIRDDLGLINRGQYRNYGPSWKDAQAQTRTRDKVCVDCGISPEDLGRELSVHHHTPFNWFGLRRHLEANALSNLTALCNTCHASREGFPRQP